TVESANLPLDTKTVATGDSALGKSSRVPIPLYLDVSAKDVTISPGKPITWTLTMQSSSGPAKNSATPSDADAGLPSSREAVRYFPAAEVQGSFATAGTLFRQAGERYSIITGRHDKPGGAEVHLHDTDLMYVVQGSATYVTGGTVAGAHSTAPGEIRGDSITGGDAREISQGDVMVVPAGTPHWFKDVRGEFLYYLIKVRGPQAN
ncbi:MAG: cupin domain-containing protein, partial [Bryobacteraceae bacterium]